MISGDRIRIHLELFEGPLDLLLHLIQEQHIDIAAVSISEITQQYLGALNLLQEMDLDVAGEYLVMAATLILIKSRLLLPPSAIPLEVAQDGLDSKENLINRLREYQIFNKAGRYLYTKNELQQEIYARPFHDNENQLNQEWIIEASILDLLKALKNVFERFSEDTTHVIRPSPISIREKMTSILTLITTKGPVLLSELFRNSQTRQESIVVFLAILELVRMQVIHARQKRAFGDILIALIPVQTA